MSKKVLAVVAKASRTSWRSTITLVTKDGPQQFELDEVMTRKLVRDLDCAGRDVR